MFILFVMVYTLHGHTKILTTEFPTMDVCLKAKEHLMHNTVVSTIKCRQQTQRPLTSIRTLKGK